MVEDPDYTLTVEDILAEEAKNGPLPIKIEGGSGGPVQVVALVPPAG